MKLKLFGRDILIGKDLSQFAGRADDFYSLNLFKYGTDYKSRNRLKAYKNIVYGCVSLIGEACGDYEPYVERKNGDQWEKIDHELIDLLNRPGGRDLKPQAFSKFDLFEATVSYQLLQGDCFWYMALGKTTGRAREIVVLRPDRVGTDIDPKTGEVNGYFIRQSTGDPMPLEVEEVLRFPLFNPEDPYQGKGPIESGSDYIVTDESSATYTKNFFRNNAGLSGVLNIKGEITKGAFKKFARAWREKYEGVDNAGKVAILRGSDADFTKVGLGINEIDMSSLRKMSLADVAMLLKTPLELLGRITEGAGLGRGNIETLEYIFAKYNIDKKMKRFDAVLQFALERYYGLDPRQYRVRHENIIPEDKEFELNERDKGVDRWLKRNEIRDEEGLDPIDGGDQLFVPAMSLPINEASETPPATSTSGIRIKITRTVKKKDEACKCCSGKGEHYDTGFECYRCDASGLESDAVGPMPCDGRADSLNIIQNEDGSYEHAPNAKHLTKAERQDVERFRSTLMRNQARYERQYRKTVKPIFREQRKEALFNLEAHASNLIKAAEQKLFDDAAYDAELVKELTPMLTDLAQTQGGLALVFAGDTENEFHMTSPILSHIQQSTQRMATNFNDETLEKLNKTLAEGIQAGEGLSELKKRVNGVYDDIDGYRSERIARTETLKASNNATAWAYRQTGYVKAKAWAVNPGACEQCNQFDGKTVPLDDPFLGLGESYSVTDEEGNEITYTNDYDTVETPPLHPNCRCTIIPVR